MFRPSRAKARRHVLFLTSCFIFSVGYVLTGCISSPRDKYAVAQTGSKAATPAGTDEKALLIASERFEHKQYQAAIKELRGFLNKYPKSKLRGQGIQLLGASYFKTYDCAQTIKTYKHFLNEYPQLASGQIRWRMGECYLKNGEYKQALTEYQLVLDRYPQYLDQEQLLYKIGLAAYKLGWLKQAQASLLKVSGYRLTPGDKITLLLTRAKIARELKDYRTAWQTPMEALDFIEEKQLPRLRRLTGPVRSFLLESIDEHLPVTELKRIVTTYPGRFPAGQASWKIIQLSRETDEPEKTLGLVTSFLNNFPRNHPRYTAAQSLKKQLEEELRVNYNKIGVILPFTGKRAPFGQRVLRGIELAVEEANLTRKNKLALIIKDSQGKSPLAAGLFKELVEKERVIAVLGPILSRSAQAAARLANELKTPMITPAASAPGIPQTGPYVFRNCLTIQTQAESIAGFAIDEMELNTFGVLYPENAYGRELADLFVREIEDRGGRLLITLSYPPQETDFRPQIEALHTVSPQAVFLPDYYDKIMILAPQIDFYALEAEEGSLDRLIEKLPEPDLLGWQSSPLSMGHPSGNKPGLKLPDTLQEKTPSRFKNIITQFFLLGTNGWYNHQLLREGAKSLEKSIFTCGFFADNPAPLVQNFRKRFKHRFWQEPDLLAAQAYDSANILLEVLRQGKRTRRAVQEELSLLPDYEGVTGTGSFALDGEIQKELVTVGIKKRRFIPLTGDEKWLTPPENPPYAPLLSEKNLEKLLPWELYHLLQPLELFENTEFVEAVPED